jgi:hypothetical protein
LILNVPSISEKLILPKTRFLILPDYTGIPTWKGKEE